MNLQRFIISLCVLAALVATAAENDEFGSVVQPFLQQHCFACHGPEKQKSGIRYDRLTGFQPDGKRVAASGKGGLKIWELPGKN